MTQTVWGMCVCFYRKDSRKRKSCFTNLVWTSTDIDFTFYESIFPSKLCPGGHSRYMCYHPWAEICKNGTFSCIVGSAQTAFRVATFGEKSQTHSQIFKFLHTQGLKVRCICACKTPLNGTMEKGFFFTRSVIGVGIFIHAPEFMLELIHFQHTIWVFLMNLSLEKKQLLNTTLDFKSHFNKINESFQPTDPVWYVTYQSEEHNFYFNNPIIGQC